MPKPDVGSQPKEELPDAPLLGTLPALAQGIVWALQRNTKFLYPRIRMILLECEKE